MAAGRIRPWPNCLPCASPRRKTQFAAVPRRPSLADGTAVPWLMDVQAQRFHPIANATVEAHVVAPGGTADNVSLAPMPLEQGVYTTGWSAARPGSYMAEVVVRQGQQEAGRDVLVFRREEGVAENFRTTQNRELLEKLAEQTGGHYYTANRTSRLVEDIV